MKTSYKGNALDLIQTVYMEQHVPIVYCYITFNARIDVEQLKSSVSRTAKIVPQILCRYDYKKNRWCTTVHDADSIVKVIGESDQNGNLIWDLRIGPQLRINFRHQGDSDSLQICMSHILADGAGLLQYLALLCGFYNNQDSMTSREVNHRSILPVLYNTAPQRIRCKHNHAQKMDSPILLPDESNDKQLISLRVSLSMSQMAAVKEKAKALDVTLNDVFMASFIHAIKDFISQDEIAIPCPADLRKYDRHKTKLTVANMTGKYLCRIPLMQEKRIVETALTIHKTMEQQKSNYDCFKRISLLQVLHSIIPKRIVRHIIKHWYLIEPASYTNIGVIDERQICFHGAPITECYVCGTYRQAPSYQVSISTYGHVCTLAANMLASDRQKNVGIHLLEKMKSLLLSF